jgi:hypothetical protein
MVSSCSNEVVEPPELDELTGVWELTTTVESNSCDEDDNSTNTQLITLIQCGDEVTIINENGLWGTGKIFGERMEFTGSEIQEEDDGSTATVQTTGMASGTSIMLEGTFTTQVTFDTSSAQNTCVIVTEASMVLVAEYLKDCIDRDQFGDPTLSDYILPWPAGKSYILNNSYCVPTGGHRLQQAYDFLIPVGHTIIASRAGIVRQVKEDSPDDGLGSDHNHVMIEHSDGTVGFYAHLKQKCVFVEVGENVMVGQPIALAGHSGTTDVVHLHFGVYGNYPPREGNDRAINFRNMEGPVDCRGGLVMGAEYTAK